MRDLWARWQRALDTPVDAASVAVFRIACGALIACDALRFLFDGNIDEYFLRPSIHFTYLYLGFVRPWPGAWMYVHFWALLVIALLVSVGLFYRVATVLLFLAYSYFFLLEQSIYMNHYYLIALFCFFLIWIPAHRAWSLDAYRKDLGPPVVGWWAVFILRFQLLVMYSYGAIAKLNADWLRGEPMYSILVEGHHPLIPPVASHFAPALLAYAIAYGGIVADAAIPLLLAFRRTVWIGFAYAFVFHALNAIFLNIGIFSYLAIAAITIFFPPDWPRRWLGGRMQDVAPTAAARVSRASPLLLAGMHAYMLFQLLFPFRHLLFPGLVGWTEEGHRFAWHMKLRQKQSLIAIRAFDPATDRRWNIDPREDLIPRQQRKLGTFPDIMLQYAHYHRDRLRAEGVHDPVITVDWFCSLNGRPYQRLIDPSVNLGAVDRTWRHATWILPLSNVPADHASEADLADPSLIRVTDE